MIRIAISTFRRVSGALALGALVCVPGFAKQSLLVFPVDKPESVEQSVADTVQSGLRARVEASAKYDATTFYAKSPLVARAVASGAISAEQMASPFTVASAAQLARAIGADLALIGSVEDASVDPATNKATVTISAQMVSAVDSKALKTAGASGEATKAATPADALLRLAADNAAEKAAGQLLNGTPAVPGDTAGATSSAAVAIPAQGHKKSKNRNGLLIGGLLLVGVIIASSHSGGGGSNGGGGGPPPLPF